MLHFQFWTISVKIKQSYNCQHFSNCYCITDTVYTYKKLSIVKYRLIKATRVDILTLLRAGFKKTEISMKLNVSKLTVHRVEQRLKSSECLRDRPGSGRSQVISQEAIKKALPEKIHAR